MKVTFEPAASDDLDRIFAWIAKDNPRAAAEMIARIEAKVMQLAAPALTPMGRPGLVPGTRELLEWPYIVVYRSTNLVRKWWSFPLCTAPATGTTSNKLTDWRHSPPALGIRSVHLD